MPRAHNPRRGSLQFWPRKRARVPIARIRTWAAESKVKPLGFVGYKVGMVHLLAVDNRPKSTTKGETIAVPSTIVECPPLTVFGVAGYAQREGKLQKIKMVLAEQLHKNLARTLPLPKKKTSRWEDLKDCTDVRILVHTNPQGTALGAKKPHIMEIALGGSVQEKLQYVQQHLGKELKIDEVFDSGTLIDVHGITTGKGFQGTVKRFGVPIRQHKAEKTKRGIGTLGPWHPNRVRFSVAQSGKMGYHLRTEYNRQVLKLGKDPREMNPSGGVVRYGLLRYPYVLLKGSVMGPKKRALVLSKAIRPTYGMPKDAPEIRSVHL